VINVGGNKVHPLRVEQVIQGVPGVRDARVFAQSSSLVGEMVACEFVAEPGFEPDRVKQAIQKECLERLRSHERPRLVRSAASITLSGAGKKTRGPVACGSQLAEDSMSNSEGSKSNEPRHVVLSGGSRGLGRALVVGLLQAGYRVSTFSRSRTEFVDERAGDERFFFEPADLRDPPTLAHFLTMARERFGTPYGLVNCAGVATVGVLSLLRDDQIDQAIATNLRGTFTLTRMVLRQMRLAANGGSIVNISSVVGLRGYRGMAVYAATKRGIDAMTRALARELGAWKIRVNSVAPGYLDTEMSASLEGKQLEQIRRRTPLGRLGVPEDVVGPVKFLLSDDSAFVTGQLLVVDGGITV
jgi:3-oxoacyl-[acyl-carrier protein] reductase